MELIHIPVILWGFSEPLLFCGIMELMEKIKTINYKIN